MNRLTIISLLLPALIACQSTTTPIPTQVSTPSNLYLDDKFTPQKAITLETEEEIFELDEAMLAMVDHKLKNHHDVKTKAHLLLDHIFNTEHIALTYETNANLTAKDAYHSKLANCASLTIMAYALAKEAGLQVNFQQINVPEYWVRNGRYNQLTGHINLSIKTDTDPTRDVVFGNNSLQIDFDPMVSKKSFSKKIISKKKVLAMFYNNKGADALVAENYPLAYAYFKGATQVDPSFSPAWGNLGILYKFTGNIIEAEKVYRHTVNMDRNNLNALSNLAILLRRQDKVVEASKIENYLVKLRNKNPYYHAVLADDAFYKGEYKKAEYFYKKAIKLDNNEHGFYFGLAKAYYMQHRFSAAKRALRLAMQYNKVKDIDKRYLAKLNVLNETNIP